MLDPWAREASDEVMRTGTGSVCPSQDPMMEPKQFLNMLKELGAEFYVHHTFPGKDADPAMLKDIAEAGIDIVLGNEYGNINGPWVEGTNRYDIPDEEIIRAAQSGRCIGLLYDEPEHLQINASQYRKDGFYPHFGATDGLALDEARHKVEQAIADRVNHVRRILQQAGLNPDAVPLVSEHVFPTMFHTFARAGMIPVPKTMKESFQSLQLSTSLGAAKQYGREFWICADLWGPDAGNWFMRFQGFPGHSPEEFASALRMSYYMAPTRLFVENIDCLIHNTANGYRKTAYGEVWEEFVRKFVPENPLGWSHRDADPDIVVIHSDDSNYGQNERLFGNRTLTDVQASQSIFHIWHLLSHGTIPAHGSCMHIPGFDFPRHEVKANVPISQFPLVDGYGFDPAKWVHPLFYPVNNVLVYDHFVEEAQIGSPKLILVGGSSLSDQTFAAVRKKAEEGAVVIVGSWLVAGKGDAAVSRKLGAGQWIVTDNFLGDDAKAAAEPFLGRKDCWMQRFGQTEVRMYPKDERGFTLEFEIAQR